MSEQTSDFEHKILGTSGKTAHFTCPEEGFGIRKVEKKSVYLQNFQNFNDFFKTLIENFSARLLKLHSKCLEEGFEEKCSESNLLCHDFFFRIRAKTFRTSKKSFRQSCQNCILRVHYIFWGNKDISFKFRKNRMFVES